MLTPAYPPCTNTPALGAAGGLGAGCWSCRLCQQGARRRDIERDALKTSSSLPSLGSRSPPGPVQPQLLCNTHTNACSGCGCCRAASQRLPGSCPTQVPPAAPIYNPGTAGVISGWWPHTGKLNVVLFIRFALLTSCWSPRCQSTAAQTDSDFLLS